jgi:hypothetical protein
MDLTQTKANLFKRHIALPQDHGSWVFILSPLLIGLVVGRSWGTAAFYLVVASMAAFLIRQPLSIAVKVYSGRRSRRELAPAWFWTLIYSLVGLLGLAGLISLGYSFLLLLAIPGAPVFAFHLYLISKRAERRKLGVELVASGVLALAAPAGYWIGVGETVFTGWILWLLVWLQSAASIVYAYLRLEQRVLVNTPDLTEKLKLAWRALLYTSFNLALAAVLAAAGQVPRLLFIPFLLQWAETIYGTLEPAVGYKPTAIGIRQLIVSSLFTLLFITAWLVS